MAIDPTEQVCSGATWNHFCEQLRRSGEQILRAEAPADAQTRAEGFRYLTRLLRIALEMHLEYADPDFPGFITPSHETAKIGADNPDNLYRYARLNGAQRYRVSGQRGSVAYLSFGTQKGGYETNGKMIQTGFIDASQLQLDADGNFEIILSQHPQGAGNWLRLEPESNALIVRQTFLDRTTEQPAQLRIERLDADQAPPPLDSAFLQQGLQRAASFVENTARLFADWAQATRPMPTNCRRLTLREIAQERMEALLLADELDVGIAFDQVHAQDIEAQLLLVESLALVVGDAHPWPGSVVSRGRRWAQNPWCC